MSRMFLPLIHSFRPYGFPARHLDTISACSYVANSLAYTHPPLGISTSPSLHLQFLIAKYKRSLPSASVPNSNPSLVSVQTDSLNHAGYSQPDYITYGDLVLRYNGSCDALDADRLQGHLVKRGYLEDIFLCNTAINIRCKSCDLVGGRRLFDEMPKKNTVSWTCLMSGYVRWGLPDEASALFCSMIREGYVPTHFTFGTALKACQESGPDGLELGKQIHALILKTLYASDIVVCNSLISMYGNCCLSSAENARQIFKAMLVQNSISWNSMISVYSQKGDISSAFELFSGMQRVVSQTGLKPNEYTYGSLVTATHSNFVQPICFNLNLLEQILSLVTKSGFSSDLYVGSALVSAFARLGSLDTAKEVFEQMADRNAVSINGLMVGLVKQNCGEEALEIFRQTIDLVQQNHDSYVVLLSACAEFSIRQEGRRKGKEVHCLLIKRRLNQEKIAIQNGLVNMYAKCGYVDDACKVFSLMGVKDLVSWNTIISGLAQGGRCEEALQCFCDLRRAGLVPSNFALISSLSACASLGWIRLGTQVHCECVKLGLDLDVSVSNSLLTLYADSGFMSECCRVFHLMPEYDQISWNCMIGALANSEASTWEAITTFLLMMQGGWSPNSVTFINIFVALSSLSLLELGRQIHSLAFKYSLAEDGAVENALLSCYAKCGEMDTCEHIFNRMSRRRDDVSWNSMVSGYVQNGLVEKAMDFLGYMMHDGQIMDSFTFATVISACASVAALGCGMEIHARGIRACLDSDVVIDSALVDMYSKCGSVDYAAKIFQSMCFKNKFSWNSMISGYARHGRGEKAVEVFGEMLGQGQRPDHVTFVGVLSACNHVGLVDQGLKYFESMEHTYKLTPRVEHYSCMVDLLGRAGELDKLNGFIVMMPIEPNALIWRAVIAACSRKCKSDLGKKAADMLLELEPENPANYILISNMYASLGRWEDVAKARSLMRGVHVKKEAGCSWTTLKDGVHVFIAGDKSHPESDKIYAKLKMLNEQMRNAGYVPQTKFALYDLEAENKEELLSYHSEKLAVAFVLIRTSEIPIRIMKNLRICGDCHSALSYISKIVSRQIIVRDYNRFHHFDHGKCSCGDYW